MDSMHISTRFGIDDTILWKAPVRVEFIHATAFRTRRRKAFSRSHPFGFVASIRAFKTAHAFSIGFISGEYGGRFKQGAPALAYAS